MPWLFAYGHFLALIPEDPGLRVERARLAGYHGAFIARSTSQWGSAANPAPMLALVAGGSCRGLALDLAAASFEETLGSWSRSEGAERVEEGQAEIGMPFRRDPVRVSLLTVDPRGSQALKPLPAERLARLVVVARGRSGTGVDYLKLVLERMREWGLEDPSVSALWKEVGKERGEKWR